MRTIVATLTASSLLWGCTLINFSPRPSPLKEYVLEGEGEDKVLVLGIDGVLTLDKPRPGPFELQESVGVLPRLREAIRKADSDEHIKAVVLKVNSPGGGVTASDIIYDELMRFKTRKGIPLVVCMMDVAASGGYYISAAADKIVAHPTTVTGSIGVLAFNISAAGLLQKLGIENKTLSAGEKKTMLSPLRPYTDAERELLQTMINRFHQRFLQVVTENRHSSQEQINIFSDARILEAQQALELNLVDSIGYLHDALDQARTLAHVKKAKVVTYAYPSEYHDNIYAVRGASTPRPGLTDASAWLHALTPGLRFMYLWAPVQ